MSVRFTSVGAAGAHLRLYRRGEVTDEGPYEAYEHHTLVVYHRVSSGGLVIEGSRAELLQLIGAMSGLVEQLDSDPPTTEADDS